MSEQMIYCGPKIERLGVRQFAVFRGGYPSHIAQEMEKSAAFAAMFVPVSGLLTMRKKLSDSTSAESVLFKTVLKVR